MDDDNNSNFPELAAKYADAAATASSPAEFYRILQSDGVSKSNAFLLLQDRFSINILEFRTIAEEAEQSSDEHSL